MKRLYQSRHKGGGRKDTRITDQENQDQNQPLWEEGRCQFAIQGSLQSCTWTGRQFFWKDNQGRPRNITILQAHTSKMLWFSITEISLKDFVRDSILVAAYPTSLKQVPRTLRLTNDYLTWRNISVKGTCSNSSFSQGFLTIGFIWTSTVKFRCSTRCHLHNSRS